MVLLNTPHNPTGMVMTREELEGVAEVALRHDLWVVCDEVYAELTFDVPHISVCSLPRIADRSFAWGLLDHGGVSLLPGTGFGASVTGHVRFSLTRPLAILQDACDRIERYARSLETLSASA